MERVQRYTAGMDLASFLADEKTVDAVSFCFGVSGEAAPTFQDRAGFRDRAGSCTGIRSAMTSRAGAIRVVLAGSPHPLKRPSAMAVHGAAPVATNCCAASPPWSRHGATTTASVARRLARASCWRNQVICAAAARSLASEQDRLVLTFVCLSLRGISS